MRVRELLVDTTAYGLPGLNWCQQVDRAIGSAATYPIKVQVPDRGIGQYKDSEVAEERWGSAT